MTEIKGDEFYLSIRERERRSSELSPIESELKKALEDRTLNPGGHAHLRGRCERCREMGDKAGSLVKSRRSL